MRILVMSLLNITAMCSPTPQVSALAEDAAIAQEIEQLAEPWIEADYVAGISIGVLQDDSLATVHLGRADEEGNRADDDTVYEIGSVSKVFTALLVADAVGRGEITLEQPAQELLPDQVTMPTWQDRVITVRDLVTHRSGLPRVADNMPAEQEDPYAKYTSTLAYEFLNGFELPRAPGATYEYSNFGMSLAGHLVCRKTGRSYDELLRERIAEPLGMQATGVALSASMRQHLATPFITPGAPTSMWEFADLPGAGGIRSSLRDMLTFAAAHLHPPDSDLGRAIDLTWKKQTAAEGPATSLGWLVAANGAARFHNGQTGGCHSMVVIDRQADLAVVVLANTALMELDKLAIDVVGLARGGDVQPRELEKRIRVAPSVMEQYVGKYAFAPGVIMTISMKGRQLMARLTGQQQLPIHPRSETEWFYTDVDATVKFLRDDDGSCHSLQLLQNGLTQTAKRIEPSSPD